MFGFVLLFFFQLLNCSENSYAYHSNRHLISMYAKEMVSILMLHKVQPSLHYCCILFDAMHHDPSDCFIGPEIDSVTKLSMVSLRLRVSQKKVQLKPLQSKRVEMRPLLSKKVNIVSTCIKISCLHWIMEHYFKEETYPLDFCFDFNHNASLQKKKVYQLSGLMQ